MTKLIVFTIIVLLIVSTSITKNSSKEIEDEIYSVKENLLFLQTRLQDTKLESDYLSSSAKLLKYHELYFENLLQTKLLKEIKLLSIQNDEIKIREIKLSDK